MALRRVVQMAEFSPHSWHLAKVFNLLAPRLGPFKDKHTEQTARHRFDSELHAYAKNFIEDLVRDVWKDPTNKTRHILQYYIDRYENDVGVLGIRNQLIQLMRDIDVRRSLLQHIDKEQDKALLYQTEHEIHNYLRDIARMLHEFVSQMQAERVHEHPSATYDTEITRLGMEAEQRGRDRFEFEEQLREVYPYADFFEVARENREQYGERLVWDMNWNNLQLNVDWMPPDIMEAEELSFEDTASDMAMDDESD